MLQKSSRYISSFSAFTIQIFDSVESHSTPNIVSKGSFFLAIKKQLKFKLLFREQKASLCNFIILLFVIKKKTFFLLHFLLLCKSIIDIGRHTVHTSNKFLVQHFIVTSILFTMDLKYGF